MKNVSKEKKFYNSYYGFMKNCNIVDAGVREEYGELWPFISIVDKNGHLYQLEISQDPEGNGPGFVFGLPSVKAES
jgi:hypothetical protein